jgi:hypothetical protein
LNMRLLALLGCAFTLGWILQGSEGTHAFAGSEG